MKKKSSLIIIIIVLIAIIVGASFAYKHLAPKSDQQNLASTGDTVDNTAIADKEAEDPDTNNADSSGTAPVSLDFSVLDWEGNEMHLSDFQGKPVILNFWASWCGPCRAEMADFDEMYAQYGDDIYFLMVNVTDGSQETIESAQTFITDNGYSFPVYFDTQMDAAMTFQAYSLPTTYFIDANGQPITYAVGTISKDIMQQGIDMIYYE